MKKVKRIIPALLILFLIVIFARKWIYNQVVTYRSIGPRLNYSATNTLLVKHIESGTGKITKPNLDYIINRGLRITSKQLNFTAEKNDNDPNKLINSRTAHCVGYAAFFATTCNYLLKKYGLDDQWNARPQMGQLYVFDRNIHKYLNSPFLKDHDFVTIENKTTGEKFAVDPTLNDYLGINLIKFTN